MGGREGSVGSSGIGWAPPVGRPPCDGDDGGERGNRGQAGSPLHPRAAWMSRIPGGLREWGCAKASASRRCRLCGGRSVAWRRVGGTAAGSRCSLSALVPSLGAGSCACDCWEADGVCLRRWRPASFSTRGGHAAGTSHRPPLPLPHFAAQGWKCIRPPVLLPFLLPLPLSLVYLVVTLPSPLFSFLFPPPLSLPNPLCIRPCASSIMMQAPSTWVHPPPPSAATVLTSWPGCGSVVSLWTDGTVASIGPGQTGAKRAGRPASPTSVARAGGGGGRRSPRRGWGTADDAVAATDGGRLPASTPSAREGGGWPPAAAVAGTAASGRLLPVATPAIAVMVDVRSSAAPATAAVATSGTHWQRVAVVGVGGVSGAAVGLASATVVGAGGGVAALPAAGGGLLGAVLVLVRWPNGERRRDEGWAWGGGGSGLWGRLGWPWTGRSCRGCVAWP